ncbi:MAG: multiheme c-type cytochrome [Proteobacteria bacterium]|nr:multiheme c-type cytochrome [Pseudomonadota bacterium]
MNPPKTFTYWSVGLLVSCSIAACHSLPPEASSSVSGVVVSADGTVVPDALVRLQGTASTATTDQAGQFDIVKAATPSAKYVTAWKKGFYNGGELLKEGQSAYRIVLNPLPETDNTRYRWIPSREVDNHEPGVKACSTCHSGSGFPLMDEWERSAHAKSATNPLFLEFFSGSDERGPLIAGLGYKRDFPHSNGSCATCHVPAMALRNPFDSDPRKASGVEREGVFCDLCHKVEDVAIDRVGGHPGTLSLKLKRPQEGQQIFFGPLDDVHPGPDSYNTIFRQSRYCAACHDGRFWNMAVYSEFQEWSESSYAKRNIHCQDCHMKPDGVTRRFALEKEGSVLRDPATVASHTLSGIADQAFMRDAVTLSAKAEVAGGRLQITVAVNNTKAGHHIPTGSPMRNMVLRVDAVDGNGRRLALLDGETIPEWAGTGPEAAGNYAGLPGKGYAKVLKRWPEYRADNRSLVLSQLYPSPFWRPSVLDYDNRIAADATDTSVYGFKLPEDAAKPIRVSVRLIYRKTFKSWLKPQTEETADLLLASESLAVK